MTKLISSGKLNVLRTLLKKKKLDGILVQRTDLFQGEEVRPCDERLAFISGFTGSAGHALILSNIAALFSDQRYTLQMKKQTHSGEWECYDSTAVSIEEFISNTASLGKTLIIGYDSWTMTVSQVEKLPNIAGDISIKWVALKESLIDEIWKDRPAKKNIVHWFLPVNKAGISAKQKIINFLDSQKFDTHKSPIFISSVANANWLLNIRGNSLTHTPFFHAMLLIFSPNDIAIITEQKQKKVIKIDELNLKHYQFNEIKKLVKTIPGKKVQIDKATCPQGLLEVFYEENISIEYKPDTVSIMKSQKNKVELAGIKNAHIKDSIAFCIFWHWFESHNQKQQLTESEVAVYLSEFRSQQKEYLCDSFPAIVGFNGNGAVVHYRAQKNEDIKILNNGVLLIDSGAHYKEGTTDVTRCFAIGSPHTDAVIANSFVLCAHFTLANTIFPKGTTGIQLDAICRKVLWDRKMDYGHGTGHGVGHVLSVHEGPASLSKRGVQEILEGMILSNEPGYYQENQFGVRQENLVYVTAKGDDFLGFENLTLIPFDYKLIDTTVFNETQLSALNDYHALVFKKISPHLPRELQEWFADKCKSL